MEGLFKQDKNKYKRSAGFIKNIVIIIIILTVSFLGQQPYFRLIGKNLFSYSMKEGNIYWVKTNNWFTANVYPKVKGEIGKRGDAVKEEIDNQKNNAVQNIWENIKNYFAEKFSKTFGTKLK